MLAEDQDEYSFGSQVDSLFTSDNDANKSTKDLKGLFSSMVSFNSRVDSSYKSDSSPTIDLMRYSIKTIQPMTLPPNKKKLSPNATTSKSSHGVNKFRSAFHKTRFKDFILEKKIVSERAFVLEGDQFVEIQDMIARRGWSKLASFPKPASTLLVKEFFANAYEEENGKDGDQDEEHKHKFMSYVRGKQVVYDPKTLNELFDLEDFLQCDFVAREKAGANKDYDGTLCTLCNAGDYWKVDGKTNGSSEHKKLHTTDLKYEVMGWSAFLLRTLLPCSNVSEMDRKRENLLVSILKGENINVGRLLAHNLYETAQSKSPKSYLSHPALISLLCERVGVIAKKTEPVVKPASPINSVWIRKISREVALVHPPPRDSHDATLPPEDHQEPFGEQYSLEERVHKMEIALDSILVNQNKIMGMLQILMEGQNQSQQPQVGGVRAGVGDFGDPFSS